MKLLLGLLLLVALSEQSAIRSRTAKRPAKPSRLIIHGNSTTPGQWPWMVRIDMKGLQPVLQCGAALIASNVVLCASHCVLSEGSEKYIHPPSMYEAVVGDWDTRTLEPIERHIGVKHIMHNSFEWSTGNNDISMLILEEHVACAFNLHPINLPYANQVASMLSTDRIPLRDVSTAECYITGWGITENNTIATQLRSLRFPGLIDPATCQALWNKTAGGSPMKVNPGMVCARATYDASTCNGDSGGPLVCKYKDRWHLFGLTSWGTPGCGAPDIDVFTDVGFHMEWIYKTLATYPEVSRSFWQSYIDCSAYEKGEFGNTGRLKECEDNAQLLNALGLFCPF